MRMIRLGRQQHARRPALPRLSRMLWVLGGLLLLSVLSGPPVFAVGTPVQSVGSGNWSDAATWNVGRVPDTGDAVSIQPGHSVVFETTATVASVDVHGTLEFSRTTSTELDLWGSLAVHPGGTLLVGAPDNPLPPDVTATIAFHVETDPVGGDGVKPADTGPVVSGGASWAAP